MIFCDHNVRVIFVLISLLWLGCFRFMIIVIFAFLIVRHDHFLAYCLDRGCLIIVFWWWQVITVTTMLCVYLISTDFAAGNVWH